MKTLQYWFYRIFKVGTSRAISRMARSGYYSELYMSMGCKPLAIKTNHLLFWSQFHNSVTSETVVVGFMDQEKNICLMSHMIKQVKMDLPALKSDLFVYGTDSPLLLSSTEKVFII